MTAPTDPERRPVAHLPRPSGGHAAAALIAVRRFHLAGEPGELAALPEGAVPAVLADVARAPVPPTGYPVLVDAQGVAHPLEDALSAAAGAGPAVLVDNLPRLAQQVRARFAERDERAAAPAVAEAADVLVAQLQLKAGPKAELVKALEAMIHALPAGAKLLGLAPDVDLRLFWRTTHAALGARRAALVARWAPLAHGLSQRLEVDRHKREGHSAQAVRAAGAGGAQFFNAGALSKAIGQHRGTAALADAEREALATALADLKAPLDAPRLVVVHSGDLKATPWLAEADGVQLVESANPFAAAAAAWTEHAVAFAKRYRAARYAALLQADRYEAEKHGPWLDAFDAQAFDDDERAALPAVVVVTSDKALAHEGLAPASAALRGHAPVRILCRVTPTVDCDGPTLDHSHLELGYLGMSHRQALVQQTTVGRAEDLQAALARADGSDRPSLTLVGVAHTIDGSPPPLGAWLHASASVEGRAHPLFVYDPGAGEHWARRLSFVGNPSPEADWPTMPVALGDEGAIEDWAFTFADQAVMERAYADHLRVVPEACAAHEDLVPVAAWLASDEAARAHQIPTVWVADRDGGLHRVAVSRPLALAAQDRLDFWHTLQELAGVHNAHVEAAVQATRDGLEAAHGAELEALRVAHAAEVARVERETAQEALGKLAAALTGGAALDLSASAPAVTAVPSPTPEAAAETPPAPAPEPEAAPEPEPEPPADPWVDSVLCTSCNDCINLNGQLFAYNGNKQAVIADPEAGTFAELVKAAEACPSNCIHPGAPLNPNEPNLDDLIARAAKFN